MEKIVLFRSWVDDHYSKTLYRVIGSLIICLECKSLLITSMFDYLTCWVIAIAVAALFLWRTGIALFAFSCSLFLSIGHINPLISIVLMVLLLFFSDLPQSAGFWVFILPATFIPHSILYGCQFLVLIAGLCVLARVKSKILCILYGIIFALLSFMTGSYGFINVFSQDGSFWISPVEYVSVDQYIESLDLLTPAQNIGSCNFTVLLIAFAIFGIYAGLMLYMFTEQKIAEKKIGFDLSDLIRFIIAAILFIVAILCISLDFGIHSSVSVFAIIIQSIFAFIATRPFVSEAILYKLNPETSGGENGTAVVSSASISFDKWDSISGYAETKKEIQSAIRPYTDKKAYESLIKSGMSPMKGLLLFGPPGTGKTTIARIIANETKMNLIVVNASSFVSMYVGKSEENLLSVFKKARDNAPCIICFDEIESFLTDRSLSDMNYETSIVSTFLTQMDGFVNLQNVLVVATTNDPTRIDPAALRPGRFDKLIFVGVPDVSGRTEMFEKYLRGKVDSDINYRKLAEYSERYTGADIKALCEGAFSDNELRPITEEQLLKRISLTRPSYTLELQKKYELWGKKYSRSFSAQEDNKEKTTRKYTWDDIKGMDTIKSTLKEKIEIPIINADQFKKYDIQASKGILLFGPPGCGKTFFAKVVADECNAAFYTINGPELLGNGIGKSEENLRKVFMDARETKPSIVFFDEIDAIAESRSSNNGSVRILNQLLTEMDGMESLSGVTVIAATNRPEHLDSALLRAGRFDTKIYIPLPDMNSIRQMIVAAVGSVPCDANYEEISKALCGYTCADVAAIVNKAKTQFVRRSIAGDEKALKTQDFLDIISNAKSSVSADEASRYEQLRSFESFV